MKTAALIVAAGRGTRASGPLPKQYVRIGGVPVLARTLGVFLDHPGIDLVQVVIAAGDEPLYAAAVAGLRETAGCSPPSPAARRGRSPSATACARWRPHAPDRVLIHDAARPFVTHDVIDRVLAALGGVARAPSPPFPWPTRSSRPGPTTASPPRSIARGCGGRRPRKASASPTSWPRTSAPQAAGRDDMTDDAAVAEWAGLPVDPRDGQRRQHQAHHRGGPRHGRADAAGAPDVRTGQGFDVHRLVAGDHVWLCGVRIAHTHALRRPLRRRRRPARAHRRAARRHRRGRHRPALPRHGPALEGRRLRHLPARGRFDLYAHAAASIGNVDVTLLCEAPKIAPHRDAMRRRIAELLGLEEGRVSVKATTTEGLGFTGRREGIAALATATVMTEVSLRGQPVACRPLRRVRGLTASSLIVANFATRRGAQAHQRRCRRCHPPTNRGIQSPEVVDHG